MVMSLDGQQETWSAEEMGATGAGDSSGLIGVDYNPSLIGYAGVQTYDRMRKSDASVRSSLRVIKAPLMAAQWYIEEASDSELDKDVAKFAQDALYGTTRLFEQMLWEALLMLDFGYYPFEKVLTLAKWRPDRPAAREREVVTWQKWAPRHPRNTSGWDFDRHGGVRGLKQNVSPGGFKEITIPVRKLLVFTLDEEGGNPEGISLLRSAWQHWYYKTNLYKVDAIQKERHGIGIPDIQPGQSPSKDDKANARKLGQNLRTNEKAFVIRPFGWEIGFLKPEGNLVDALESARHHDLMIKTNVLAQFLSLGTMESGSRAVGSVQEDIFVKSIHYIADIIRGVVNKWAIPELVRLNFETDKYPQLKVRRIGDLTDIRALSVGIRNFIESGALSPDPILEEWLRQLLDFPRATSEVMGRTLEARTAVKPSQRQGASTGGRVDKPAD